VGKDLKKKEKPVPRTYASINSMTDESNFLTHTLKLIYPLRHANVMF